MMTTEIAANEAVSALDKSDNSSEKKHDKKSKKHDRDDRHHHHHHRRESSSSKREERRHSHKEESSSRRHSHRDSDNKHDGGHHHGNSHSTSSPKDPAATVEKPTDDTAKFQDSWKVNAVPGVEESPTVAKQQQPLEITSKSLDDDDKPDDNPDISATLTENVYSLMYVSDMASSAFWTAIFFCLFQTTILGLVLSDLINISNSGNFFSVPPDVPIQVRIAGILGIILSMPLFGDLLDAVEKLTEGYNPLLALRQNPNATRCKWCLAFSLQFLAGGLMVFVIFILVLQATSVIGMFLNFAALHFISTIDDLFFGLAARGYFSESIQKAAEEVPVHLTPNPKGLCLRRTIYVLLTGVMLAGYSYIMTNQPNAYLCQRLQVQFGDAFYSSLPLFSGIFVLTEDQRLDGRVVYHDEITGQSFFRYCKDEQAWVFSEGVDIEDPQVCGSAYFISKSASTAGYDILQVDPSSWQTTKSINNKFLYPVEWFSIMCADCDDSNCGGTCVENVCVCGDKLFGESCQFTEPPCPEISYDRRTSDFFGDDEFYSSDFFLLTNDDGSPFTVYNKPVYYYYSSEDQVADLLVSNGRRYFLTTYYPQNEVTSEVDMQISLLQYFDGWHGYYDWLAPDADGKPNPGINLLAPPTYISDPMDVRTATDQFSPLGMAWTRVNLNVNDALETAFRPGPPVDTVLVCTICSIFTNCVHDSCIVTNETAYNDEWELSTGYCNCSQYWDGPLCEADSECAILGNCVDDDGILQ